MGRMGFGLSKFSVRDATRRIVLDLGADPPIALTVRFCGSQNPRFLSAMARAKPDNTLHTPEDPTNSPWWCAWATVIAQSSIDSWEGVLEDVSPGEFKPAVFSTEAAERFLLELIRQCPEVWLNLLTYCWNRSNFTPAKLAEAAELGKP